MVESPARPSPVAIRTLWKRRQGGTPSPLLLVVLYPGGAQHQAAICGPTGDPPTLVRDLDPANVERIAQAALVEPNRHAAVRFLVEVLGELESELPGLRNEGLLATHELRTGVPTRADWIEACERGRGFLTKRGRELVESLGFTVQQRDTMTWTLRAGENGTATAVAIFLDEKESYEGAGQRFDGSSPVSLALAKADADRLPFVFITRGSQIRLYAADKRIVGVGRKGRTETFLEVHLALLPTVSAGYLPLLFGAEALLPDGSFEEVLERSRNYATDLSKRLRERVYTDVVPSLATAIARRLAETKTLDEADLRLVYEQALFVLFRLVFIAYAEDKSLLPYATNDDYRQHALKTRAQRLANRRNAGDLVFEPNATDLWTEVQQLFRAVDQGNSEWGVPAYDGGLFSAKADVSPVGAVIDRLELTNAEFGPPLAALLVDVGEEHAFGAIDFRSLSVREFGTIYEGLLESNLSLAQSDLALDKAGAYVPASDGQSVVVARGEVYLHNQSGARKASGSYFTKEFAVEHLLDHALEPALDDHIERLAKLIENRDEVGAGEAFFDFRVADIAMGSGHFLVNVVDHIEARLTSFLTDHPLPVVNAELANLRKAALERLANAGEGIDIEQAALVRRQVARRCIYGVDINVIAVELARLALWIHTFVPGLPLSFLDRTLVCGNSLTGIGSLEEAVKAVEGDNAVAGTISLARDQIERYLENARKPLGRLGRISDATPADIAEARQAQAEALDAVRPARTLFDLAVAARLGEIEPLLEVNNELLEHHPGLGKARELAAELDELHFPVAFPEVFLRDKPGFDCIVGNPPWDKVRFEAEQFWVTRSPGLNAMPAEDRSRMIAELRTARPSEAAEERQEQRARERLQSYVESAFALQGGGHHDFAKLFLERAIRLVGPDGTLGYVLPRQALVLRGWEPLRRALLDGHWLNVVEARNKAGWLFDDVEHRYMIVLLSRRNTSRDGSQPHVDVRPSAAGAALPADFDASGALRLDHRDLDALSDSCVIPWLEGPGAPEVFSKMRTGERLGSGTGWIEAVADSHWDFSGTGRHRSYVATQASEGSWRVLMARHVTQYAIDDAAPYQRHIASPAELSRLNRGVECGPRGAHLASIGASIVFRYPSRNDDSRTLIAAILPESGYLPSKGYTHTLVVPGECRVEDILALLGYVNSFTADWWARRFVDRHITGPVLANLPIPNWDEATRDQVAAVVGNLVLRRGYFRLPGGSEIPTSAEFRENSDGELRTVIEMLVARGFDFTASDLETLSQDFSSGATPDGFWQALGMSTT